MAEPGQFLSKGAGLRTQWLSACTGSNPVPCTIFKIFLNSIMRIIREKPPEWQRYSKKEVENLILKLRKEGKSNAEIGLILRDSYGIPDIRAVLGKKLSNFLEEKGEKEEIPEDLKNLLKKAVKIKKHLELNKKDIHNKRNLQLVESKIRRLAKYYIKKGKLPKNWKYTIEQAELLVGS